MNNEPRYRQMELNPQVGDGAQHSPDTVRRQMEQASQQAAFYEQQREQWEIQRRELEEVNEHKALFEANLNDIGLRLHNVVRRVDRELESIERERAEIEQVNECFKRHLQILSALHPSNWSKEGLKERLREAFPKLDRADNDYYEAFSCYKNLTHSKMFSTLPNEQKKAGLNWTRLSEELCRGLAFHLPLFLLLLISWGIYHFLLS